MQLALRAEEIMPAEAIPHRPVMLRETLQLLRPAPGAIVVDGTLGAGGHAEALLGAIAPHGRLYGIDRDPTALAHARERLAPFGDRFTAIHGDHRELPLLLEQHGVDAVDTVLLDLGISSMQLDDPSRGFALTLDGPLDMRMDPGAGPSAAELLQTLPESEIASILYRFGQERRSRESWARRPGASRSIQRHGRSRQFASRSTTSSWVWTWWYPTASDSCGLAGVWLSSRSTLWRTAPSSTPYADWPKVVSARRGFRCACANRPARSVC
jgi:16S rRNA (cytosine(1402)-N(4))-methyltransferase